MTLIVAPTHIDVMLSVAIHGPEGIGSRWSPPRIDELLASYDHEGLINAKTADLAGRVLLEQCISSVSHFHRRPAGELPGPRPNPVPAQYEWTDFGRFLNPIEACRAIGGYEFHAGRDPGWLVSGAHWFCHRFLLAIVSAMQGYQQAPDHWTTQLVLRRARERAGDDRR